MSLLATASFSSANGKSIGKSKSRPRGVTSKLVTALGCCRDRLLLAELPGLLSAVISGGTDAHLSVQPGAVAPLGIEFDAIGGSFQGVPGTFRLIAVTLPSAAASLYDVDAMPPALRKAHRALDDAVDKLYRSAAFTGDRDRAEHLFGLYEKLVAPLIAAASQPTRAAGPKSGRRLEVDLSGNTFLGERGQFIVRPRADSGFSLCAGGAFHSQISLAQSVSGPRSKWT